MNLIPFDKSRNSKDICFQLILTPLGEMKAAAIDDGICLLEFSDRSNIDKEFVELKNFLGGNFIHSSNEHLENLKIELGNYFTRQSREFSVPLCLFGTELQQKVWQKLASISFGFQVSYSTLAESIGKAGAVRAVANAVGQNRLAILIPCHRIIGKDGRLRGYAGGLERKRWLLEHELQ